MKKTLSVLTGVVLALSLALTALTALLYIAGTDGALMHRMFLCHAPMERTGLPEGEYRLVADMTAAFLAGERDVFQHTFTADGRSYVCFAAHEQQHMLDCQQLFALCRTVLIASAITLIASVAALRFLPGKAALRAAFHTLWELMALAMILVIWGAVDFDGLFVLFHRLSFSNDLWLLNPATDLLIRLMPTGFFVAYAALIGGAWLLICGIGCLIIRRMSRPIHRGN